MGVVDNSVSGTHMSRSPAFHNPQSWSAFTVVGRGHFDHSRDCGIGYLTLTKQQ
jgi:hypothetical protein